MSLGVPAARYGLDAPLCLTLATLIGWGLVMVASASVAIGEKVAGSPLHFFERQLLFSGLGIALALAVFAVPLRSWQRSGFALLLLALVLLTLVLIPGVGERINSSRRWLRLGVFNLQASEPARLALILYLSGYIVRRQLKLQNGVLGLALAFMPLSLASLLLLAEPDFGAAVILFAVAILMLFVGGTRLRDLLAIGALLTLGMALLALAAPYRVRRLLSFVDPWSHAQDTGFQLVQSLIAVGRGQVFGVGLGNSVQKLLYLPEMHTDFIFAVLAEEFGLIGVACLIALYAVIVWRGFVIGRRAELRGALFESYLAYGLSAWLGLQALINMAVNMGLLPTKGLTLPLVSYGGSSLITVYAMLALILRVDHENRLAAAGHPQAEGRR
ncbi:MAG: putative lipid II flippase FtsW [Gammaproteobacteria bacterium]|nr:putative lipid II flippase FtsW [Gammaproteobacteria bacterium]